MEEGLVQSSELLNVLAEKDNAQMELITVTFSSRSVSHPAQPRWEQLIRRSRRNNYGNNRKKNRAKAQKN